MNQGPAWRLTEAHRLATRRFHEDPLHRDWIAEYDAIQHWELITITYSGIEQAMKCLLEMRGKTYPRGTEGHKIGKLFHELASEEQAFVSHYYSVYKSLHDYIPPDTAEDFLKCIGNGYTKWRYFLLDGPPMPTTNTGAMLETWAALVGKLTAKAFTNHGPYTVKHRLHDQLFQRVQVASAGGDESQRRYVRDLIDIFNAQPQAGVINYCSDLIRRAATGGRLSRHENTTASALTQFSTNSTQDRSFADKDYRYFIQRAQTADILWDQDTKRFTSL